MLENIDMAEQMFKEQLTTYSKSLRLYKKVYN